MERMATSSMAAPSCRETNNVRLFTRLDGRHVSHFRLREFANAEGLAIVHPCLLESLERVRRDLCRDAGEEVWVLITDATRTQADLERLAARLGYTDKGGLVSRNSRHLTRYGGIAADIVALNVVSRTRVAQRVVGDICRQHFDFVKDDYADGHVHADNRARAL